MKIRLIALIGLLLVCSISNAQEGKKSGYLLVKELNAAHQMLIAAVQYTDGLERRIFLAEANSNIAHSYHLFLQMKPELKKKLTEKDLTDLEGCFVFIQNMTTKDFLTPNDPARIGLWHVLADKKLAEIVPKILR